MGTPGPGIEPGYPFGNWLTLYLTENPITVF